MTEKQCGRCLNGVQGKGNFLATLLASDDPANARLVRRAHARLRHAASN